jgi:DNA-binding transcriptional MocR family regulator
MEKKISIAPGNMLTADSNFSNYIRLGIGEPFAGNIEKSLETLGQLIKEMIGKKMIGAYNGYHNIRSSGETCNRS